MNDRKAGLVVMLLVVLSTFHLVLTVLPVEVRATTLFVGGSGGDNYTTIQEAIDAAKPGDTIYVYNGTYNENVAIYKPLSLIGEDKNNTIIDGGGIDDVVYVSANWVNITGFTVTNGGVDRDDAGIELETVWNCSIANNNVTDNRDGIYVESSTNIIIMNNNVSQNWKNGILISGSDNILTAQNKVFWNSMNGITITGSTNVTVRGNTLVTHGIVIRGSTLPEYNSHTITTDNLANGLPVYYYKDCDNLIIDNVPMGQLMVANCTNVMVSNLKITDTDVGIEMAYVDDVISTGNNISYNFNDGIEIFYSTNVTITNSDISDNWNHGIYIWSSDDIVVTENRLSENADGIRVRFSTGITIEGNNISYNGDDGIDLGNSANVTVTGNNVSPENDDGVYLFESTNVTITDNNISINWADGVHLSSSTNITITDNNISLNDIDGIDISLSTNVTIENNIILDSWNEGVYLSSSTNIMIAYNNISLNDYGFSLYNSTKISVYHNSVIGNINQAYDDRGNENSWDDGYPSGGNHWSDYTGIDDCSGPNQDICPDPDGIGDTPYVIDPDTEDRYPLMSSLQILRTRPPIILQASLSGRNLENVTLNWSLSPDDGTGFESVVGYRIYRNTSYDSEGLGYALIASLPGETSGFVDNLAGDGNPENYYYRVCAVDLSNNTSCAKDQAGKLTRLLSEGLNLLSIPLVQSDESIETVFQTVPFDKSWYFNPLNQEWKSLVRSKPYSGNLGVTDHAIGIWLNVIEDSNLTAAGVVPLTTTIQLKSGWNLVGFPSFKSSYSVGDLKAETGATRVEGFNPSDPPYFLKVLTDGDILQTSSGYWIYVETDAIWTVSNS